MTGGRIAAWVVFSVFLAVTAGSIFQERLLLQSLWTDAGYDRLLLYVGVFAAWTMVLRRFRTETFVCATAGAGLLYACWTAGVAPIAAVLLILTVALVAGRSLLPVENPQDDLIATATGLALIIFVISLAVTVRVNFPWTYAGVFVIVLAVRRRTTAKALGSVARLRGLGSGAGNVERLFIELLALILFAHFLLVLKPEVSADGLAMHLAIPAQVYNQGLWDFNFSHAVWSVMPMGGDWLYTAAYTLGGEFAARLLNFAAMLLVTGLLYVVSRTFAAQTVSLAVVTLFASAPLVQLVTGSLFVENIWAALIVAALAAIVRYHATGAVPYLLAGAVLVGCAISCKFGAISFVLPLLVFLTIDLVRWSRVRLLAPVTGLMLLFAAPPYVTAWVKTGNPVFPFFNSIFRSPHYDSAVSFADTRFPGGVHLDTLWQITFHTSRFLEGDNGAFGLQYFLFVPLTVVLVTRRWPYAGVFALISGVWAFLALFSGNSNVRYVYPAMAVISIAIGAGLERLRAWLPSLCRTALAVAAAVTAVNFYLFSTASWYHRDFFLPPFDPSARQRYVEFTVAERLLTDQLNRIAPDQPVLFLESTAHAQLRGKAYTNTWHHTAFVETLKGKSGPIDVLRLLESTGLRWVVYPCRDRGIPSEQVGPPMQWFLSDYAQVVSHAGRFCLARTRVEFEGAGGIRHAEWLAAQPATAGPGLHDDFSRYLQTRGSWIRDRQFTEAHASTLTYSDRPGDSVVFQFEGSAVRYTATRAANRGIAELLVDGELVRRIDLYCPQTEWRHPWEIEKLSGGVHVLEIRVSAGRNRASKGSFVDVDALTVK